LTKPATGLFAWTATFAKTSSSAAGTATDVNSYEYNTACPSNAGGGEGATVTASQYTNTNAGPTLLAGGPVVRLDNKAPTAPAVFLNPNGRAFNWLNDAVSFSAV